MRTAGSVDELDAPSRTGHPGPGTAPAKPPTGLTDKRHVLEALSGLLLALFVAILSSTIVSNALPRIISDLGGTQAQYTWVVSAALLAMTSSTPIWGKLADLFSKKLLVQLATIIFISGSILCGITTSTPELIAFRVLQGLGMGGLQALVQVVIATIIPPRERGRYMGYLGAVVAAGTVGGPLLGGVIVDTPWLGWRWCFYVTIPIALIALVVVQKTLSVPLVRRKVKIDYLGALCIAAGISLLLIWTSLAGKQFEWWSLPSLLWAGGGLLSLLLAVVVERRAAEPVVPPRLFSDRTTVLAVIASFCVGIAMFGSTVYLTQYFQLARGATPTHAGLMILPMIAGLTLSSTVVGQLISRYGRWKPYLVLGGVLLLAGVSMLGLRLTAHLPYAELGTYMAMVGTGLGMSMQNLVLAVQNTVGLANMGAASSTVAFFRSMGGATGVSALGAVLSSQVAQNIADGLRGLGVSGGASGAAGGQVPSLRELPAPVRAVVEDAYGVSTAHLFGIAAPLVAIALVAILLIREVPLRHTVDLEEHQAVSRNAELVTALPTDVRHDVPAGGSRQAAIAGTVSLTDGTPVAGAVVTVTAPDGRVTHTSSTDRTGGYRVPELGSGRYTVTVVAAGVDPVATGVRLAAGSALRQDLTVTATATLSGTVRSLRTKAPLADVLATVADRHGAVHGSALTDEHGRFRFTGLSQGSYTVTATSHPRTETEVRLAAGERGELEVALPAPDGNGTRRREP